jgi:hypothetical protein
VPASQQLVNTLIPGTTSLNPYLGAYGQTLAEVRFASVGLTNPPTIEPQLSADLIYEDYWTDPDDVALRTPDARYAYQYADLTPLLPPTNTFCSPNWLYNCRITINYPTHIHEIWQLTRIDDMGNADPADDVDNTCIVCHTTRDANNVIQVPAGQLDLTTDLAQDMDEFYRAYRELLFGANPSMTDSGARSSFFIEKMTGTELDAVRDLPPSSSVDHTNMLTGAELKLISEWLDLGAQNFNDPFDLAAPQN